MDNPEAQATSDTDTTQRAKNTTQKINKIMSEVNSISAILMSRTIV
jgi:hypothetical protein